MYDFVLGLRAHLSDFKDCMRARGLDVLADFDLGLATRQDFLNCICQVLRGARSIHFTLRSFDFRMYEADEPTFSLDPPQPSGSFNVTNYELFLIRSLPELCEKTHFYSLSLTHT